MSKYHKEKENAKDNSHISERKILLKIEKCKNQKCCTSNASFMGMILSEASRHILTFLENLCQVYVDGHLSIQCSNPLYYNIIVTLISQKHQTILLNLFEKSKQTKETIDIISGERETHLVSIEKYTQINQSNTN